MPKSKSIPVVISSIIPSIDSKKILISNFINKLNIHTPLALIRNNMLLADAVITETVEEAHFIKKYFGIKKST